jgi:hypothetical protein
MNNLSASQLAVLRDRLILVGGYTFTDEVLYIADRLSKGQCLCTIDTPQAVVYQFLPRQPVEGFQQVTVNQG